MVDKLKARLDFAKANGFASQTLCLSLDKSKTADEQLRRAKETAHSVLAEFKAPDGFDVVFECTGAEPIIQVSVHVSPPLLSPSYLFRLTDSSLIFRLLSQGAR